MFKKSAVAFMGAVLSFGVHAKMYGKSDAELVALAKQYGVTANELAYAQTNTTCFESLDDSATVLDMIAQYLEVVGRDEVKMWAKGARSAVHLAAIAGCERIDDIRRLDSELGQYQAEF